MRSLERGATEAERECIEHRHNGVEGTVKWSIWLNVYSKHVPSAQVQHKDSMDGNVLFILTAIDKSIIFARMFSKIDIQLCFRSSYRR